MEKKHNLHEQLLEAFGKNDLCKAQDLLYGAQKKKIKKEGKNNE